MRTTAIRYFVFSAVFISLSFNVAFPQENLVNTDARQVVDLFLNGLSRINSIEGERILSDTSWPNSFGWPYLLKHETISESMFDTDIPEIKGYKRLLVAKVRTQAGTTVEKRLPVIAYPGARDKKWRVLLFNDRIDVDSAIDYGVKQLGNTKNNPDSYNYSYLVFWYVAAGKFKDAYQAYKKALDLDGTPLYFDDRTEILFRIMRDNFPQTKDVHQ
jgi:hypothetical protein